MNCQISVVIAMYNVESYIAQCLDSIVNQTLGIDNIEVIIVNDNSTDGSIKIAQKYADRFSTIRIIQNSKTIGPGLSRNIGLKNITSEYFTFIDSDDFISNQAFEEALKLLKKNEANMLIYEYQYFSPSGKKHNRNPSEKLFTTNRIVTKITEVPEIIFSMSMCNRVFHTSLKKVIKFGDTHFEDILPSIQTTLAANKIIISNEFVYYYRKRDNPKSKSRTDEFLSDIQKFYDHFAINLKLKQLIETNPHLKLMVDWFNSRSMSPFIFELYKNKSISKKDKVALILQAENILSSVSTESLSMIENPISRSVIEYTIKKKTNFFIWRIRKQRILSSLIKKLLKIKKGLEFLPAIVVSFIYRCIPKNNNVWLICERGYDAKDNGYAFFEYIRRNHPKLPAYYLISKKKANPTEVTKLEQLGNIVEYGSLKHKVLFVRASKLISAHKGTIEPWNYSIYKNYFRFFSPKQHYVFLQHGITKDDVSYALGRNSTFFDLFITGAKPEYDYISKHFGYGKNEVVYTGFSRFDLLHNNTTKNQILFMPTWRKDLINRELEDSNEQFINTSYFKTLQSFLNNEKLHNFLAQFNINLYFYPHDEVQPYIHNFKSSSNNITISNSNNYNLSELLRSSKMLITDFSSVFFDFAYMKKPVIYYHFDKDYYQKTHYKPGYFDYVRDGFGPIYYSEHSLVEGICQSIESNYTLSDEYIEKISKFFPLHDKKNSERIFHEIKGLDRDG